MPFVVPPALYATAPQTSQADLLALLSGVNELIAPGAIPGPLAVFGEKAQVVVAGRDGGRRLPLVAAARFERGRVVAVGHDAFFSDASLKNPDNNQFLINCARWVLPAPTEAVAVVEKPQVAEALEKAGIKVVRLTTAQLQSQLESPSFDAVILNASALDGKAGQRLSQTLTVFVRSGGGVVMDSLGWGWLQMHPGQSLAGEHGGNKLFSRFGMVWTDGFFEKTGPRGWTTATTGLELLHGRTALTALQKHAEGTTALGTEDLAQVSLTLTAALSALPSDEPRFFPQVIALTKRFAADTTFPLGLDKPVARLKMVLDQSFLRRAPLERQPAHATSGQFPGAVATDAPRVNRVSVFIESSVPEWHGTGLYVPPGGLITISAPKDLVEKGLAVRVGSHTDTLWDKDKWERFPEVSLRRTFTNTTLRFASAFGGTLFLDIPRGLPKGRVEVIVSGAVAAPRFVRGETLLADWKAGLRNAPGPWAELEGKNLILSVPSAVVRTLDDPEALMAYWDEVSDLAAELYQIPKNRERPERYTVDKQISAGYMHSGYPIMTYGDDIAQRFVDLAQLRGSKGEPVWGFYHELGHNHQREAWTWDGCGEVTNNLFSVYACEKLNNDRIGHPALQPEKVRERLVAHLAAGAPYEKWKDDPFLALTLFLQLREAFGWEPFKKVFAEYEALAPSKLPKTDEQKRDQFMMRFSKAINKNLGPFFSAWGVPTSEGARNQIARLPRWMPTDWPKR